MLRNITGKPKMQSRAKVCGLSEYQVSRIQESSNNRLVDLGKSLIAMLDGMPDYDSSKAATTPIRTRISGLVGSETPETSRK